MRTTVSLSDAIFRKFERSIISGDMQPGARFPSQKEICATENVSRTVVREAIARLAAQNLVTTRQGSGVFVSRSAGLRAFQVSPEELSTLDEVIRLLEMRLAVETEAAGLAAARRTSSDIDAIHDAFDRIEAVRADQDRAAQADAAFHLAIARATHNDYFTRIIDFFGARLVPPRRLSVGERDEAADKAYADKVRAEHQAIIDAIIRMDIGKAREAARNHMQESLSRHRELARTPVSRPG